MTREARIAGRAGCVPGSARARWGMSACYAEGADDAGSARTIRRTVELGITFVDTAENYGPYTNDDLLGRSCLSTSTGA